MYFKHACLSSSPIEGDISGGEEENESLRLAVLKPAIKNIFGMFIHGFVVFWGFCLDSRVFSFALKPIIPFLDVGKTSH